MTPEEIKQVFKTAIIFGSLISLFLLVKVFLPDNWRRLLDALIAVTGLVCAWASWILLKPHGGPPPPK